MFFSTKKINNKNRCFCFPKKKKNLKIDAFEIWSLRGWDMETGFLQEKFLIDGCVRPWCRTQRPNTVASDVTITRMFTVSASLHLDSQRAGHAWNDQWGLGIWSTCPFSPWVCHFDLHPSHEKVLHSVMFLWKRTSMGFELL